MALKKTYSKDKKTCTVTFTVTAEAAQGAKTMAISIVGVVLIHLFQKRKMVLFQSS